MSTEDVCFFESEEERLRGTAAARISDAARVRKSTRAKHLAGWTRRAPGSPRSQSDIYSRAKAHPCERLARAEGVALSWLAVLKGLLLDPCADLGCDRSYEMGALSFAERRSRIPGAILTAYWAGSRAARVGLGMLILDTLRQRRDWTEKPGDRIKIKGVILDAVDDFRGAHIGDLDRRAKLRGLRVQAYRALFKLASGLLHEWLGYAQPDWLRSVFGKATDHSKAIIKVRESENLGPYWPQLAPGCSVTVAPASYDENGDDAYDAFCERSQSWQP